MQDVDWAADTPNLLRATFDDPARGVTHYMVVESLPQGGWDWVAWANDSRRRSLHGAASSRSVAMAAAEHAAFLLQLNQPLPSLPAMAFVLN